MSLTCQSLFISEVMQGQMCLSVPESNGLSRAQFGIMYKCSGVRDSWHLQVVSELDPRQSQGRRDEGKTLVFKVNKTEESQPGRFGEISLLSTFVIQSWPHITSIFVIPPLCHHHIGLWTALDKNSLMGLFPPFPFFFLFTCFLFVLFVMGLMMTSTLGISISFLEIINSSISKHVLSN